MPTRTISLYQPFLGLVSGKGDASLTLDDVGDEVFELPEQTRNNQTAVLDGVPVVISSIHQALGPQPVVALVGGVQVKLSLTPVRIVVEGGVVDDSYIYFPGLPEGASIVLGVSVYVAFPSGVSIPLCLASETLIRTCDGLKPIGEIEPGEKVLTMDHGPQAVRWIGRRHVDFLRNPEMREHAPVLIKKDAFGEGKPFRDTIMSPQHCVLFEGWEESYFTSEDEAFAPAKSLVNGKSVVSLVDCPEIDYCHVLFDMHHVIWAHGLPVESLFLGDLAADSLMAQRRQELLTLFPDIADMAHRFRHRARARIKSPEVSLMMCA